MAMNGAARPCSATIARECAISPVYSASVLSPSNAQYDAVEREVAACAYLITLRQPPTARIILLEQLQLPHSES